MRAHYNPRWSISSSCVQPILKIVPLTFWFSIPAFWNNNQFIKQISPNRAQLKANNEAVVLTADTYVFISAAVLPTLEIMLINYNIVNWNWTRAYKYMLILCDLIATLSNIRKKFLFWNSTCFGISYAIFKSDLQSLLQAIYIQL